MLAFPENELERRLNAVEKIDPRLKEDIENVIYVARHSIKSMVHMLQFRYLDEELKKSLRSAFARALKEERISEQKASDLYYIFDQIIFGIIKEKGYEIQQASRFGKKS